MTMNRIRTEIIQVTQPAVTVPVAAADIVAVVGSLGSSESADNTAIQSAFPVNMPRLISNAAAFTDLASTRGTAHNFLRDLYANVEPPVVFVRIPDPSARGDALAPTEAQVLAGITAVGTIPADMGIFPRWVGIPEVSYAKTATGNTGPNQAGDPASNVLTAASPVSAALDTQLDAIGACAVVSVPPGNDGAVGTAANAVTFSALNRGVHKRTVHVFPRETVASADADFSGAVLGAIIDAEVVRGVGRNVWGIPVVTAGGVPRPYVSNTFGENASDDASVLSHNNIMTVVRGEGGTGLILYGNTFAVDPTDGDDFRFIQVRRIADEINHALNQIGFSAFRHDIGDELYNDVERRGNALMSRLETDGSIVQGSVERDVARNTPATQALGEAHFIVSFTAQYPVRTITYRTQLIRPAATAA